MSLYSDWLETWSQAVEGGLNTEQENLSVPLWNNRYSKLMSVMNKAEPDVGLTPKRVIWHKNKTMLYHFSIPGYKVTKKTPVLMVYAMINKPYILDVEPGNSFVEALVKQGYDVYMIDWGEAGIEDRRNGFAEYILDYLKKAIDKVRAHSGQDQINMFSYCMGGTIGTMTTALFQERIKNLVVLAAPIDFRHAKLYNNWLSESYFDVDKLVDTFGNVPSYLIDFGNKMLKPMVNFVNPWVRLLEKVDDDHFVHNWRLLNKWANDGTDFPGQTYKEWIHNFYQHNKLINGEIMLRDQAVDLAKIECPVLILTAEHDHIVPVDQTRALFDYISSEDKEEHNYPVGHVSLVFGGVARKRVYQETADWLAKHD